MDEASHVRSSKFGTYRKTPLRSCDVDHVKLICASQLTLGDLSCVEKRERENALSDTQPSISVD